MATTSDLAKAVLQELVVIDADEEGSAADVALVKERYSREYERLLYDGKAWWNEATIPEEVMGPLTEIVAARCAKAFALPPDRQSELLALQRLNALSAKSNTKTPTKAEYF